MRREAGHRRRSSSAADGRRAEPYYRSADVAWYRMTASYAPADSSPAYRSTSSKMPRLPRANIVSGSSVTPRSTPHEPPTEQVDGVAGAETRPGRLVRCETPENRRHLGIDIGRSRLLWGWSRQRVIGLMGRRAGLPMMCVEVTEVPPCRVGLAPTLLDGPPGVRRRWASPWMVWRRGRR
jgi:hypothetical protein